MWDSKEEFILLFGDPEEEVVVVRFELVREIVPRSFARQLSMMGDHQ